MPGIFGYQFKKREMRDRAEGLIHKMADMLKHGGKYASALFFTEEAGMGIVDLVSDEDMGVYRDEKTGIACCIFGDIFRYVNEHGEQAAFGEKGKAGRAKLVALYRQHGRRLPERLIGDFNIAVHDVPKKRLLLFNDRFGFRHLYVYEDNDIVMFAPEIKAFLNYSGFSKQLDPQGVADFFNYFYQLGDRTMFANVKMLPAAACLCLDGSQADCTLYWHARYTGERKKEDVVESVETGYRLFQQSMEERVAGKSKLLVPLSGGLDSRLILATAKDMNCNIQPVTFGEKRSLDYRIADTICRVLGLQNHHRVAIQSNWVPDFSEEMIWLSEGAYATLATTRICGFAKVMGSHYDGLLNGIFGGHLSFGSPYFTQQDVNDKALAMGDVSGIIKELEGWRYDMYLAGIASAKLNDMVHAYKEKSVKEEWDKSELASSQPAFRKDQVFLSNRIRRGMNSLDLNRFYYKSLLPFACYDLYEFYLTLSPELLLDHFLYKSIFKAKFPRLAEVPWQRTGVNLYTEPSGYLKRKKMFQQKFDWYLTRLTKGKFEGLNRSNYMYYDRDYRKNSKVQRWVEALLLSDRSLERGYFHREGVRNLLRMEKRGYMLFHEIGKLVCFELWARFMLDGEKPTSWFLTGKPPS